MITKRLVTMKERGVVGGSQKHHFWTFWTAED